MKNLKKITLVLGSAMVIGSMSLGGMTVSAAETAPAAASSAPASDTKEKMHRHMQEVLQKWDALSAEQKAEIYALIQERNEADGAILDRLADMQVLDADTAARMKQHRQEILEKQKQTGECPLMKRPHHQPRDTAPAN